jgi:hypothetical protein
LEGGRDDVAAEAIGGDKGTILADLPGAWLTDAGLAH